MTQGFQQPQGYAPQQQFAPPQQPQYAPPAPQGYPAPQPPAAPQQFAQPQGAQAPAWLPPEYAQQNGYDSNAEQGWTGQAEQPVDTAGFFGGGSPYVSWDNRKGYQNGSWYGGVVLSKRLENQTDMDTGQVVMSKFNASQPLQQLVVEIQTAMRTDPQDDGKRRMAIKSGLVRATREAYQKVGANDVQIGGWLYARKTGMEPIPNSKFTRNIFEVLYAQPGQPDPAPQPMAHDVARPQQPAAQQFAPQPGQVIAQMPMPVQAYPGQGPAQMPQAPAAPAGVPADQAAQFAAWQAQQAAAQQQQYAPQPGTQQPQPAQSAPDPQQGATWSPFNG